MMLFLDLLVGLLNVLPELIVRIESQFFSQYDVFCKVFRTSMVSMCYDIQVERHLVENMQELGVHDQPWNGFLNYTVYDKFWSFLLTPL